MCCRNPPLSIVQHLRRLVQITVSGMRDWGESEREPINQISSSSSFASCSFLIRTMTRTNNGTAINTARLLSDWTTLTY